MKRYFLGTAFAAVFAAAGTVAAQSPQTPATRPLDQAERSMDQEARTVTVEGCVMREADVPGRDPNFVERMGIGEDFILTDAEVVQGAAQGASASTGVQSSTESSTAASGAASTASGAASGSANAADEAVDGQSSRAPADSGFGASDRRLGAQASMYELEGDNDRFEEFVGQRVRIAGTLENVDQAVESGDANAPSDDLAELSVTSIQAAGSGSCSQ